MHCDFGSFRYIELLNEDSKSRIPQSLVIQRGISEEAMLLRLLLGTIDLEHIYTSHTIKQRTNYLKLGIEINKRISHTALYKSTIPIKGNTTEIESYLANNRVNTFLYRNILAEFSNFIYQKGKSSHLAGFVHIYKCIEYVSYPFPLIFASKTRSFVDSYKKLQLFFSEKKGELSFYSTFLKTFIDDSILNLRVEFVFDTDNLAMKTRFNNIIKQVYDQTGIVRKDLDLYDNGEKLSIPYKHFLDFTVTLRNRFFHMLNGGQNNISSYDLDVDTFFKTINDLVSNWTAYVYSEMVKIGVERY